MNNGDAVPTPTSVETGTGNVGTVDTNSTNSSTVTLPGQGPENPKPVATTPLVNGSTQNGMNGQVIPNINLNIYPNTFDPTARSQSATYTGGQVQPILGGQSTMPTPSTDQIQPAQAGNGAPPASIVETRPEVHGPGTTQPTQPTQPEDKESPERVEKKDGRVHLTQEKLNSIIAEEKAKEAERVKAEVLAQIQAQTEEAARQADINAAKQRGEYERLWTEEQSKTSKLADTLSNLQLELQSKDLDIQAAKSDAQNLRGIMESEVDRKIAGWPNEIRILDPKEMNPDGYNLQTRLQWVAKAEEVVRKMTNAQPPVPGNSPMPAPVANATDQEREKFLQEQADKYKRDHPFQL